MTANPAMTQLLKSAFGFEPADSQHHFQVIIPAGNKGDVLAYEHFMWDHERGSSPTHMYPSQQDGQLRIQLKFVQWQKIAEPVRSHFNLRLRRDKARAGSWKSGTNLLRRDLGKELLVLMWAIEDTETAVVDVALANWQGLLPEERWWLYTQTAAATGHGLDGRGRGWRRALRYALTENPAHDRFGDTSVRLVLRQHVAAQTTQDDVNDHP